MVRGMNLEARTYRSARADLRREERVAASLGIRIWDGIDEGLTRDISPSGIFFLTKRAFQRGEAVSFTVLFEELAGHRSWALECDAQVMRVEAQGDDIGIAVRIRDSRMKQVV
jgi:hypothetical protein